VYYTLPHICLEFNGLCHLHVEGQQCYQHLLKTLIRGLRFHVRSEIWLFGWWVLIWSRVQYNYYDEVLGIYLEGVLCEPTNMWYIVIFYNGSVYQNKSAAKLVCSNTIEMEISNFANIKLQWNFALLKFNFAKISRFTVLYLEIDYKLQLTKKFITKCSIN
jgi:hypothetical protein